MKSSNSKKIEEYNKIRYNLYENSVQNPKESNDLSEYFYKKLNKNKTPKILREDFCGTFYNSVEWVKRSKNKIAYCLDIDPIPLSYGYKYHYSKLNNDEKKRIKPLKKNVISVTNPKSDIIQVYNFSFNIIKKNSELLKYFKAVKKSLKERGILILEIAGGPGFIKEMEEKKRFKKNRKHWYTYLWHQKSFDPISHYAKYAIHFKFPNGKVIKDAFIYDWRLWTIPELKEILINAGFNDKKIHNFWEKEDKNGNETGVYYEAKKGYNDETWIAYLVARN